MKLEPNTGINYSGFAETSYAAAGAATVTNVCDEVLGDEVVNRCPQSSETSTACRMIRDINRRGKRYICYLTYTTADPCPI